MPAPSSISRPILAAPKGGMKNVKSQSDSYAPDPELMLKSWRFSAPKTNRKTKVKQGGSKLRKPKTKGSAPESDVKSLGTVSTTVQSSSTDSAHSVTKRSAKSSKGKFKSFFGSGMKNSNSNLDHCDKNLLRSMNFVYLENLAAQREEEMHKEALERYLSNERCQFDIVCIEPDIGDEVLDWLDSHEAHVQVQSYLKPEVFKVSSLERVQKHEISIISHSPDPVMEDFEKEQNNNRALSKFTPVFPIIVEDDVEQDE